MALDATVAGASANSYPTRAEADAYFADRLYSTDWTGATNGNKDASLMMATRYVDAAFDWTGSPTTTTQELAWPRTGMVDQNGNAIDSMTIPRLLKEVVYELAIALLRKDITVQDTVQARGITSIKAGPVSIQFREVIFNILPPSVLMLIPESWYTAEDDETDDFIFETI